MEVAQIEQASHQLHTDDIIMQQLHCHEKYYFYFKRIAVSGVTNSSFWALACLANSVGFEAYPPTSFTFLIQASISQRWQGGK